MRRLPQLDLPRAERAREAAELRAQGLSYRAIAERMGIARSYAAALITDPTGEQDRARKARYGKPCLDCGKTTDGSNGRAKAPDYCVACTDRRRAAQHGTLSKYRGGCRCEACRVANREDCRERRHRGSPPPTHGNSGYINYGCRCEICTAAATERLWLGGYNARWVTKVRGTEPPVHGTQTAYNVYQCRCDVCRDWCRDNARRRRERKKAAA